MSENKIILRPQMDFDTGIFLCPVCDYASHNYSECKNHIWLEHLEGGENND